MAKLYDLQQKVTGQKPAAKRTLPSYYESESRRNAEHAKQSKRSYAKPTGKTTRGERSTTGKLLPTKSTKPSKPAAPDKLETVKSRREPAGGKRTAHPLPDRMSPGQAFAYGTERAGASLLGAGEALTDTIGAGFYGTLAGVSSLGGLAENPVSRWARAQGNAFLDNSVTRDWEQSIEERYRPTDLERNVTGAGQTVVQMLPAIGTSHVVSAARGGASALNAAQNAIRGQQAGQALFGLQAAGYGAQEARQSGASLGQSLLYGASSGLMESLIERVSGGIPGLGKGVVDDVAAKVATHPLVRQALDMAGEGGEEAVSAMLEPFLKRAIYDPSAENATAEEIGQAAVMGALASGILKVGIDLPTAVGRTVANAQNARAQIGTNEDIAGRVNDSIARGEGPFRAYDQKAADTAPERVPEEYRAETPQNVEYPTVPIITLSMDSVAGLNDGTLPKSGNYLRKQAYSDTVSRLGLDKHEAAYVAAENITRNGDQYVIKITKPSLKKMLSASSYPDQTVPLESIAVLSQLERIAQNGVYFRSEGDRKNRPQIAGYDHLLTTVYLDGVPYVVDMRVRVEDTQAGGANRLYHFTPELISVKRQKDGAASTAGRHATGVHSKDTTPSSISIIPNAPAESNTQSAPTGPERVPVQQNTQPPRRTEVDIPIAERTWKDAGSRKVNAFQYDHPELRPYFLRAAQELRSELHSGTRGERFPIKDADGYITGYTGVKRDVSEPVEQALDNAGLTYDQIEKAIDDLIADNGQENYAAAKKVELVLDNMLTDGYTSIMDGEFIEPDEAYLAARNGVNAALPAESHEYRMSEEEWTSLMGQENIGPESSVGAAQKGFDPWSAFQGTKSEFFPEGANAARPVDVPTTDPEGRRIRKTASTGMGAKAFPDEVVGDIQNMVLSGKLSYDPVTDQASIQRAQDHIRSQGFERSLEEFTSSVERGVVSKDLTTLGQQLLVNSANARDGKATAELLSLYAQMETTAGQAVQAASILRKLDPSYQLYAVQKAVERLNWATQEKGNRKGKKGRRTAQAETGTAETAPEQGDLLKDLPGARPGSGTAQVYEAADAAKKKDIAIDPALIEKFTRQTDQAGRDAVLEEIYQNVADQVPSNFMDKFNALRYLNMLGNLKTQARNVIGNSVMKGVNAGRVKVQAAAESLASRMSGGKFQRTTTFSRDKALYEAAKADFQNVKDLAMGEQKYSANHGLLPGAIQDKRTIFKNNGTWGTLPNSNPIAKGTRKATDLFWAPLEGYRNATNWAMETGDVLFSKSAYADALSRYLKANGVTAEQFTSGAVDQALLSRARDHAVREAQEATFRDNNAFSDMVSGIGFRNANTIPKKAANMALQGVLPFRKTPANVAVRAYEYSPLGIITTAAQGVQKVRGNEDITGADIIRSLSKSMTGLGLFLLGMAGFSSGLLTGGEDDDEKQAAMDDLTGKQNYALYLPKAITEQLGLPAGFNFTMDWMSPAAMPLFMGAEVARAREETDLSLEELLKAAGSMSNVMLEMSMLQGINEQLEDVSYSENPLVDIVMNAAADFLTQGITSTLIGQIERTGEEKRMSTYTDKNKALPTDTQYLLGSSSSRIPGWDYQQVPYIDAWGREEPTGTLPMRAVNNFLNPAYTSFTNVTPVDKEIQRLYDQTGNGAVVPRRAEKSITVDGKDLRLTAEKYIEFARKRGQTAYSVLDDLIQDDAYRSMSDEEKADMVSDVYEYAASLGKAEVSSYQPDGWVENAVKSGVDPERYILYRHSLEDGMSAADKSELMERRGITGKERTALLLEEYPDWADSAEEAGVPKDVFVSFKVATVDLAGDKDKDGNTISGSKKEKVLNAINAMDVNRATKNALYNACGYAANKLYEAPWY